MDHRVLLDNQVLEELLEPQDLRDNRDHKDLLDNQGR